MSPAPLIQPEEIDGVKRHVVLCILLKFLDQDMETIRNLKLHLSFVYLKQFQHVQKEAALEAGALKKQLRSQGIKIIAQRQFPEGLHTQYLCRGYHHEMTLLWSFLKAQVALKLSEYLRVDLTDGE